MTMTTYKNSKLVPYYILGDGSFQQLSPLLEKRRKEYQKDEGTVFIVDHYFSKTNLISSSLLHENDEVIFADTSEEPKTEYVDSIKNQILQKNRKPKTVVGIGGGSALDIAKAISVLLTNPGPAENYQGWDLPKNPAIYKIGIPTIAGTGAEFTRTAVMTGPVKKLGINSDQSVFDQVILDPTFLATVPTDQFIYTAMDCFVHNEESLLGRINDTMTIALAEKSTQMLLDVFLGKMDYGKLMVASGFGGLAVANSSVGICHPFSYGLSLVLGLRHGYSICIAFNQLEEYYPSVKVFKEILKKYKITLPKVVTNDLTDDQLSRMADAVLLNERPLSNAFGNNWKEKFSKEKVISLLRQM